MIRRVSILAVACALAGCAATPPASRPEEARAALARPEPDPACRGAVQGLLAANALETVTVKLQLAPGGRAELVEVLSPELTPAAREELARAMAGCAWAPTPDDEGARIFTTTWVRSARTR